MSLSPQTDRRNNSTELLVRLLYGLDLHDIVNQYFNRFCIGKTYFNYSDDISEASERLNNFITYEENAPKAKKRRPNLNFYQMGLIDGDVLTFVADENIHATIVSENKVEYNSKEYSLTKLTQELKGLDHAIQPTGEWRLEDQNLLDLYNETYS